MTVLFCGHESEGRKLLAIKTRTKIDCLLIKPHCQDKSIFAEPEEDLLILAVKFKSE